MQISTKCSIAVHCLIFIYEAKDSVRVTSNLLAQSTGCNPVVIRNIFRALQKAGILQVTRGTGGAVLCKDPSSITLYQIYNALEPNGLTSLMGIHACDGRSCPVAQNIRAVLQSPYKQIEDAIQTTMEKITLDSLLADFEKRVGEQTAAEKIQTVEKPKRTESAETEK